MIKFKENQDKIYISKNKIVKSLYDNHLDLHLVYSIDENSGYKVKFVRIITFENIYLFEDIKNIKTSNFKDDFNISYFENGGYEFNKKEF